MAYLFLDTESVGLSLQHHDLWELAFAFNDGEVESGFLQHSRTVMDEEALEINQYHHRCPEFITTEFETTTRRRFMDFGKSGEKLILVGANPGFDAYRLSKRWGGIEPWHYRMIDVSTYAMPLFGMEEPQGLHWIRQTLVAEGLTIPEPDHTAAGDVETVRAVFYVLRALYELSGVER